MVAKSMGNYALCYREKDRYLALFSYQQLFWFIHSFLTTTICLLYVFI